MSNIHKVSFLVNACLRRIPSSESFQIGRAEKNEMRRLRESVVFVLNGTDLSDSTVASDDTLQERGGG